MAEVVIGVFHVINGGSGIVISSPLCGHFPLEIRSGLRSMHNVFQRALFRLAIFRRIQPQFNVYRSACLGVTGGWEYLSVSTWPLN